MAECSGPECHYVKGTNNRLSNGIVPLQNVCEQVGCLGPVRLVPA